jgi:hypothetical protein
MDACELGVLGEGCGSTSEGFDQRPVRPARLDGPAPEDKQSILVSPPTSLNKQPGLADPGLASDHYRSAAPLLHAVDEGVDGGHLDITADQR